VTGIQHHARIHYKYERCIYTYYLQWRNWWGAGKRATHWEAKCKNRVPA